MGACRHVHARLKGAREQCRAKGESSNENRSGGSKEPEGYLSRTWSTETDDPRSSCTTVVTPSSTACCASLLDCSRGADATMPPRVLGVVSRRSLKCAYSEKMGYTEVAPAISLAHWKGDTTSWQAVKPCVARALAKALTPTAGDSTPSPDLMMRGSRLWVMAIPTPPQAPHCRLVDGNP